MYIYSLLALALTVSLSKHIRTSSPFHCLALAWLYVLDSCINAAYTAAFSATWFLVLLGKGHSAAAPGADTMKDTSGFTNPKVNVSSVEVVAAANEEGIVPGQEAVAASVPAGSAGGAAQTSGVQDVLDTQSINSITIIIALWTVRAYFCLVMLSWARSVVRQHIAIVSVRSGQYSNASASKGLADDPFGETKAEGQGWKGKLGRFMIALGPRYFLGAEDDEEGWVQSMGRKFGGVTYKHVAGHEVPVQQGDGTGIQLGKVSTGDVRPTERERRRRSGTGPPLPEVQAQAAALQGRDGEANEGAEGLLKVPSQ